MTAVSCSSSYSLHLHLSHDALLIYTTFSNSIVLSSTSRHARRDPFPTLHKHTMSGPEGISGVGDAAGAFTPAYAAFAINVDSRQAEASSRRRGASPPPAYPYSGGSILKHGKSRSSNLAEFPAHYRNPPATSLKGSRSPPVSSSAGFRHNATGRQGVRFDAASENPWRDRPSAGGHRRSSTAAFIEYLKQNMPIHPQQTQMSYRITPKRAFLLFCVGLVSPWLYQEHY